VSNAAITAVILGVVLAFLVGFLAGRWQPDNGDEDGDWT
jgi:uncharacterized membrane protein